MNYIHAPNPEAKKVEIQCNFEAYYRYTFSFIKESLDARNSRGQSYKYFFTPKDKFTSVS